MTEYASTQEPAASPALDDHLGAHRDTQTTAAVTLRGFGHVQQGGGPEEEQVMDVVAPKATGLLSVVAVFYEQTSVQSNTLVPIIDHHPFRLHESG